MECMLHKKDIPNTKICEFCNKSFSIQPQHRPSSFLKRKVCSKECASRRALKFVDPKNSGMRTHGMSKTRQWFIWQSLRFRCTDKKTTHYRHYGGRGITYDPKWETFEGFWEDMKEGYTDGLEIDRINNDGNYCKENCRWATRKQQVNNTRRTRRLTLNGVTKSMKAWSEDLKINYCTLQDRLNRGKWSVEKALLTPIKKYV